MSQLKLFLFLIFPVIFLFTNCDDDDDIGCIDGIGSVVTRTINVPNFDGIVSEGAFDILITQGNVQEVTAIGESNIIDDIETDVTAGIWNIELSDDCYDRFELTIRITVPDITKITTVGSGSVFVNDFENQGDLEMEIIGSGNIELNEFAGTENLDVEITGSGNVQGNSDFVDLINLDVSINGSGNYNGFSISANNCDVNIFGSGNAEVHVIDNLDVNITGSGSVFYKGDPTINSTITGSGSLIDSN